MAIVRQQQVEETDVGGSYDDTLASGVTLQTNADNLEDDLNGLRSQMNKTIHGASPTGSEFWYDTLSTRGILDLDTDLTDLEDKRILCRVSELENVTVGAASNVVTLTAPGETPTEVAAIGAVTTLGAVVAELPGAVGTGSSTVVVTGQNALQPKNLLTLVDTATNDVIVDGSGNEVYGLLQIANGATDGAAFDNAGNAAQISFVVINATRTGFDLSTAAGGLTIQYAYVSRSDLDGIPEECFVPFSGFVDNSASVEVTYTNCNLNQGTTFAPLNTTITQQTNATNQSWDFVNAAGANIGSFGVGAADGNILVVLGDAAAAVDSITQVNGTDLDVNVSNSVDILNGLLVDSGGTQIDIGVTAGLVESAGALTLESNSADATLQSTTGGNVVVSSASAIDVDATTSITINTANAADASTNDILLTAGNSTAGTAQGAGVGITAGNGFSTGNGGDIGLSPGDGGATGTPGLVDITSPAGETEATLRLSPAGTNGEIVSFYSGSSDPNATVTATRGSLFLRDTGATGQVWVNTDNSTTWTQLQAGAPTTNLSQAITNQGAPAFAATNSINWGLADADFLDIEDSAAATLLRVTGNAGAGTSTVLIGTDADFFDVDAADNDFLNGAAFDTGAAGTTINVGVTANQIDSGGALTVTSADGSNATFRSADVATTGSAGTTAVTGGDGGTALGNAPGSVTVTGGTAGAGSSSSGGGITLTGGLGDATAAGGSITGNAGAAAAVGGLGGSVSFNGGNNAFLSNGGGGSATLAAGTGQGSTFAGGTTTVRAGSATSGGLGGQLDLFGGSSDASGETIGSAGAIVGTAGNNSGTDRAGDIQFTAGTNSSAGGEGGRILISAGTSAGATNAPTFTLTTGTGGATGANGNVLVTGSNDEDESAFQITTTGTNGDSAEMFVGTSNPNGSVTGLAGSLFFRDTGATGELYLNTSAGSGTTWQQVLTGTSGTTSLSAAITAEGSGNFTATNSISWGIADNDSVDFTGPGGAGDTIVEINALAAGDTFNVNADTIITGNTGVGGNSIQLLAGAGAAATNPGTGVRLVGGAGNTTGAGGTASMAAGGGGATGNGGPILIDSGDGGGTSGNSGDVTISTGTVTDGDTGTITLNVQNAVGTGTNGGDIVLDAGDSPDSQEGGLVTIRNGDSSTGDAGYTWFDSPNDDDEHVLQFTTGGTNGETTQLLTGTRDPGAASIAAEAGSLYLRNVDAASGSAVYVNVNTAAGEGTDWERLVSTGATSARNRVNGTATANVTAGTDFTSASYSGTLPDTSAVTFNTDVDVFVNGLLQLNGTDVNQGASPAAGDLNFPTLNIVSGDQIVVTVYDIT